MKYLIDGNNLIHALPGPRRAFRDEGPEIGKRRLLDILLPWALRRRHKVTVVFDGGDGRRSKEAPDVWIVEEPFADRAIKALLPRGAWTLVSSDAELRGEARRLGRPCQDSESFAQEISPRTEAQEGDDKPDPPRSAAEIRAWRDVFGPDLDDLVEQVG